MSQTADVPEARCPQCAGNPPLVYTGSLPPRDVAAPSGSAAEPANHYLTCRRCGRAFMLNIEGHLTPLGHPGEDIAEEEVPSRTKAHDK